MRAPSAHLLPPSPGLTEGGLPAGPAPAPRTGPPVAWAAELHLPAPGRESCAEEKLRGHGVRTARGPGLSARCKIALPQLSGPGFFLRVTLCLSLLEMHAPASEQRSPL